MCMLEQRGRPSMGTRYGEHNHYYYNATPEAAQQSSARGGRGRYYGPPSSYHRHQPQQFDYRRSNNREGFHAESGRGLHPDYRNRRYHGHGPSTSTAVPSTRTDLGTRRDNNRAPYKAESRTSQNATLSENKKTTSVEKKSLAQFGDWQEFLSSSGKKYYYNIKTEISKWEKPKEWIEHDTAQAALSRSQQSTSGSVRSHGSQEASSGRGAPSKKQPSATDAGCRKTVALSEDDPYLKYLNEFEETAADSQRPPLKRTVADVSPLSNDGALSPPPRRRARLDPPDEHHHPAGVVANSTCDNSLNTLPSSAKMQQFAAKGARTVGMEEVLDQNLHSSISTFEPKVRSIRERQYRVDEESNGDAESMQCSPSCSSGGGGDERDGDHRSAMQVDAVPNGDGETSLGVAVVDDDEMQDEEEEEALPELSLAHTRFYAPSLTAHVTGWNAEQFDNQAWLLSGQSCAQSVKLGECSTELKTGRSLVRSAEISATLLDSKVAFAAKQYQALNPSPMKSVTSTSSLHHPAVPPKIELR